MNHSGRIIVLQARSKDSLSLPMYTCSSCNHRASGHVLPWWAEENTSSHPASCVFHLNLLSCQHLNQHQDRITASTFIWPSGSRRYLQFCRNLNDPHSSKSQERHKMLSISVSLTFPIMVTRNVSLNVSSLNRVPCSERCLHFAASLLEP